MRRTTSALLLTALVATTAPGAALLATPASGQTAPAPAPRAVAAAVVELPVSGIDPAAASELGARALLSTGAARRTVLLTARRTTRAYGLVGVTWRPDPAVTGAEAFVRTREAGIWSGWTAMGGTADEAPDVDQAEVRDGVRTGTAPLWVGVADGVQVRVDVTGGAVPRDLRVALVDPGTSTADAQVAVPRARLSVAGSPSIRTRAEWGADESIRSGTPSYASGIKGVVVHHTASSNDYAQADVPRLIRGFYAYHVKSNGWSDIGYNVLVDRFGTAWEGRAGGLERPVIGSHAGGFNTGTVGISVIGTYESVSMSSAALESVARVSAWKLAAARVDPLGSVTITSGGGTKWPAGTPVTLPTVMGHRQVSSTSCPGTRGFAALPGLRTRTAALLPAYPPPPAAALQLVAPATVASGSTADLVVRGGTPRARIEMFFRKRGEAVFTRRRDGVLSDAGNYRTTLVVSDDWTLMAVSGGKATAPVTVLRTPSTLPEPALPAPVLAVTGPVTGLAGSTARVTATGPAGADVSLWLRRDGAGEFVRRALGRFDATGRWTSSFTLDRPHQYLVTTATVASTVATTRVGAVPNGLHVYAPVSTPVGRSVPLVVQGTPGAPVELWFSRRGEVVFDRRRSSVLGPDGTYRTSYVAADDMRYLAVSGTRSSTRGITRVTSVVADPRPPAPVRVVLSVPASSGAGTAVPVVVTGSPGAAVTLWAKRRGATTSTRIREAVLSSTGRYTTTYAGVDDHELWATAGGISSVDVANVVVPVLAGPASAVLGTRVSLAGRARPGDTVVLETRRRGTTTVSRTMLTADGGGVFGSSFGVNDEYSHRALVGARIGASSRTTVAPTATGPASAPLGSRVALAGTARPGAIVEVWFRNDGETVRGAVRALPVFRLGRTLTATSTGRWSTSFLLPTAQTWFAVADGNPTARRRTVPV